MRNRDPLQVRITSNGEVIVIKFNAHKAEIGEPERAEVVFRKV